MGKKNKEDFCGFCGRDGNLCPEGLLFSPFGLAICEDCIRVAYELISAKDVHLNSNNSSSLQKLAKKFKKLPDPKQIKKTLDDYVIGQSEVKKILAVSVYNHYKRVNSRFCKKNDDVILEKSNVLLAGPTGTGKTLLAKTLAKILDVPFAVSDATTLTEAGYVGEDVENILLRLVQAADYDLAKAELGIVYIDEIDKIGRKTDNVSITRDVSGEGVQQALLKIVEGTVANIPPKGGRKHPEQEFLKLNTENILFICGGAFVGLEKMVQRRIGNRSLGFKVTSIENEENEGEKIDPNDPNLLRFAEPEDLIHFGLIPELIGRLPVLAVMNKLEEKDLLHILTEPKNALVKQYKKLFSYENIELEFEPEALKAIAEKALKRGTGARGLRSIMEHSMMDLMFDVQSTPNLRKCIITRETILKKEVPKLVYDKK